jgi:hypothetical protein
VYSDLSGMAYVIISLSRRNPRATKALSVGLQFDPQGAREYDDPMKDPKVIAFIKREREKEGRPCDKFCC